MHTAAALSFAVGFTACSPLMRPEAAQKPPPMVGAHVRERRWLGLGAVVVAGRPFTGSYTEFGPGEVT